MRYLTYASSIICLKIILVICSLSGQMIHAQNLVIDPSFEDVKPGILSCAVYYVASDFDNAFYHWTNPTTATTDIYNTVLQPGCFCHPFSTNFLSVGNQAPRTGNGYCGLINYGVGNCSSWHEYVQGKLSAALIVGQLYEVSFWVSLADKSAIGSNNIGVKFSTTTYSQNDWCPYYTTPDVNYTGPGIVDKNNWVQISFSYTPSVSGLDNFIIGNFLHDSTIVLTAAPGDTSSNYSYYYIDDVVIAPSTASNITTTSEQSNDITIFPNPFAEQFTISELSTLSFPLRIELYDNLGRLIKEKRLEKQGNQTSLNGLNDIAAGIYWAKITTDQTSYSKKLIKK